jgi:hypothetical protein
MGILLSVLSGLSEYACTRRRTVYKEGTDGKDSAGHSNGILYSVHLIAVSLSQGRRS